MVLGITAAFMIIQENKIIVIIGAALLFYKNVLDKVDGSLARAKGLDSRRGRFYDSLADFIVTLAVFSAITYKLLLQYKSQLVFVIGFSAMIFSMLQCSFFIYYQVSFIKHTGRLTVNRLVETVTEDDLKTQNKWTLFLQRAFMVIYGWQDILIATLHKKLIAHLMPNDESQMSKLDKLWYENKPFLTFSSLFSIGTHIFLICLTAVFGRFEYYLFINLIFMNLLLIFAVIYHYNSVKNILIKSNF
jgi:phosphatidylglycerophosphate synthase